MSLQAGFAEAEFTPEPGLLLFGQMHERWGERVRDPLMACAAAFRGGAAESDPDPVILVTVDVCILDNAFVAETQEAFQSRTGIPGRRLLLHATHTHVAPATLTLMAGTIDQSFLARLRSTILDAAVRAVEALEPVALFAGTGHMDQMGWNRRAMFSDGSSRMYGHAGESGFVGMEGPRDPALPVLMVRDEGDRIRGVILSFSTHPNTLENGSFYSADIPGEVRRVLKAMLGPEMVAIYLTGAAGNTAPSLLDPYDPEQPWREEAGLGRSGLYLAGEAAKVMAAGASLMPDPVVRLAQRTLSVPLRKWPGPGEPTYPQPLQDGAWPQAVRYYRQAEEQWPARVRQQSPFPVRLNVLRLGDAAVCTNPAELFVEYGLQIREESPARVTLIGELTDGYAGYVPTLLAFERGGYETWCAPSSQLAPGAGPEIEEATREMIGEVFGEAGHGQ